MGFAPGPGQGGTSSIAGSSDVSLNNPQNDHALTYSSSSSKWINKAVSGAGSRHTYPIVANANGTWPTFQSVYPSATLPLASTSEVIWIKRSSQASVPVSSQFEEAGATNRTIGGIHMSIIQTADN